jgi:SSS family solute:Na+ symporter
VFIGALVIIYTTTGGAKAVGVTHKQQMAVMFGGLFVAFGLVVYYLSEHARLRREPATGRCPGQDEVIDTSWDPEQVHAVERLDRRLLPAALLLRHGSKPGATLPRRSESLTRRAVDLWMNGLLKIPMQFFILLIGVLVFVFYLFNGAPVHWNSANVAEMDRQEVADQRADLDQSTRSVDPLGRPNGVLEQHATNAATITTAAQAWVTALRAGQSTDNQQLTTALAEDTRLREAYRAEVKATLPTAESNDKDYIFITFIMDHMPVGIIGLLLAMIFCAGMSSTSAN